MNIMTVCHTVFGEDLKRNAQSTVFCEHAKNLADVTSGICRTVTAKVYIDTDVADIPIVDISSMI